MSQDDFIGKEMLHREIFFFREAIKFIEFDRSDSLLLLPYPIKKERKREGNTLYILIR